MSTLIEAVQQLYWQTVNTNGVYVWIVVSLIANISRDHRKVNLDKTKNKWEF